jgi:hypothetical protein
MVSSAHPPIGPKEFRCTTDIAGVFHELLQFTNGSVSHDVKSKTSIPMHYLMKMTNQDVTG